MRWKSIVCLPVCFLLLLLVSLGRSLPTLTKESRDLTAEDIVKQNGQEDFPSAIPSLSSSTSPSQAPSDVPSNYPSISSFPTIPPSNSPSPMPSGVPSRLPNAYTASNSPSASPTNAPFRHTLPPSMNPSSYSTTMPTSSIPSIQPTAKASCRPTSSSPSTQPTATPSFRSTFSPVSVPTVVPSSSPSRPYSPSASPSSSPTFFPTDSNLSRPTTSPSTDASVVNEAYPSGSPSIYQDQFEISCLHDCGTSVTVYVVPMVLGISVVIGIIGYFTYIALFDSSFKRASTNSSHNGSPDMGLDILDAEDDFETVYLNKYGNEFPTASKTSDNDVDILNELMSVNHSTKDSEKREIDSKRANNFSSPFIARTFNNMMKVNGRNRKVTNNKYQHLHGDELNVQEERDFDATNKIMTDISKEDEEFFAAIDSFSPERETEFMKSSPDPEEVVSDDHASFERKSAKQATDSLNMCFGDDYTV